MKAKTVPIETIIPYENNPRFNDQAVDAVAKSIREFGFLNPIVVDKNNVIICGHTRYRAALSLGLKNVTIVSALHLSDEQVKAYRIADNKTSELATWNYEALVAEIQELQDADYDTSVLGFSSDILEELLYHEEEDTIFDGETDPDYLPTMSDETFSEFGQIYTLGEHRLMCNSRLDKSLMSTLLFDGHARLYLSRIKQWQDDMAIWLRNASPGLAAGSSFYVMLNDEDTLNVRLACRGCDLEVHETLFWLKSNFHWGEGSYQVQNESVLYGWTPGASHRWFSDRKQTNLLRYNNAPSGNVPVAMSVYLIRNSTNRGEIVLDNFSETGNNIIACEQTGRRCRMVVDSPAVADLVRCRWAEFVHGEGCDWKKLTPVLNSRG